MPRLLAEERLSRILTLLGTRGALRAAALTQELGVSSATIRRDLDVLTARGLITRVHGGAALTTATGDNQDQFYRDRQRINRAGKAALAEAALLLIEPRQTIYLDAGTTALALALALREVPTLTATLRVVTHGLDVAYTLNGECALYVVGGEVYGSTYSLTGPDTLATIARYRYDSFFIGCTSLAPTASGGEVTNSNAVEADLKRAIMGRSRQSILIADHSKWGHAGFATFAHFADLGTWVTDKAPAEAKARFKEVGGRVIEALSLPER